MDKKKVLFVCIHNSARSQMAEAFLRKYAGDRFEAHSAGLEPKEIHPHTYEVMSEVGLDLGDHHSKGLGEYLMKVHIGYLITVCAHAEANCPICPGMAAREHWSFEDPAAFEGTAEEKLDKFREIRDQVEVRVRAWLVEVAVPEA